MARTVRALPIGNVAGTLMLLGIPPDATTAARQGGLGGGRGSDIEGLLNSRSGRIHLFPVPGESPNVAFHNFQARGGFLVSACKNSSGIAFVEIQARRDIPCQVINPWPGKAVVVNESGKTEALPVKVDTSNGECLVFSALAGHTYRIEPKNS